MRLLNDLPETRNLSYGNVVLTAAITVLLATRPGENLVVIIRHSGALWASVALVLAVQLI